ncbi:Thioredoxin domain protein [Cellulomonas flavigena DSM 20109]|uniref:Thioredoxin domain protein n=1 Tax=Cellulomonas flavigena (strain ATCC 482 / DSM 20109 / BCRC 11376 / JCM 18109 / NBRC 3775 / NCIMB 8073 / NRS 134) TaxID=446466 RepID=D5ULF4_CELFN|nr:tetratricopeptide repeat protein [Cellulomonas flavigena]ADG73996.1 Thioredoxin domain protein [Cellulomonas flavigena DSM 20109]
MSQPSQPPRPRLDARGAVDLSALARPSTPPPGSPGGLEAAAAYVKDVDQSTFADVVQSSTQHPVVVVLWAPWSEVSQQVAADLAALAAEDAGRWLLARIDAEANPQVAAAFQAQSVPTVVAVLGGQPVPLFQGSYPREQVRGVLDQLLAAAEANGVTGRVQAGPAPEAPAEPALPPLHQEAYDAIERDDLPAARNAYERALRDNPRDAMARAGLAQVGLMQRTAGADLRAVREAAAAHPDDVDAQLAVADLDVFGGAVEDAFARLVDLVRRTAGDERERVRVRLVDLFEVLGSDDPRVVAARRALAAALY